MPLQKQRILKKRGGALPGLNAEAVSKVSLPGEPTTGTSKSTLTFKPVQTKLGVVNLSDKTTELNDDQNSLDKDEILGTIDKTKKVRPWSKKPTLFQNGPSLSFGKVLLLLGLLPFNLWENADNLTNSYDTPVTDKCWSAINERYNLPQGFLQVHNDLDLIDRCDERLLPAWPVNPGPLARCRQGLLTRPEINSLTVNDWQNNAFIYEKVAALGVPNYRGARLKLNHTFGPTFWHNVLEGYNDLQVINMMMFGWPASYESDKIPTLGLPNHASSYQHPEAVDTYLEKELKEQALIGPFSLIPFNGSELTL